MKIIFFGNPHGANQKKKGEDDGITDAGDAAIAVACADGEVSVSAADQQQYEKGGGSPYWISTYPRRSKASLLSSAQNFEKIPVSERNLGADLILEGRGRTLLRGRCEGVGLHGGKNFF